MAYSGFISTLKNVQKDPNSERLYTAEVMGEGVIVGGDAFDGQRIVYFPADGCFTNYDFAIAFSLLRKDKDGKAAGGYLDYPSMHIKALKLRGLRSEGIVIDLAKFAAYWKLTPEDFKDGEAIDGIGKELICKKYIVRQKGREYSVSPLSKRGKKRDGVEWPEFQMHVDTSQLLYNQAAFKPGDEINLSLKMHGTSQRSMQTYCELPNGFWRRLFHMKKKRKPSFALGTRRTIITPASMERGESFYGNDSFRLPHHEKLRKLNLKEGTAIYYEVVGYTNPSTTIMPSCDNKKLNDKAFIKQYGPTTDFTYGCEPGQSEMYVYRITYKDIEFTPEEIENWCIVNEVKHVPFLEDFKFTTWEDLLERVNQYLDGPDPIGKTHLREGVVVRTVNRKKFSAYKIKNMNFKIMSGIISESKDLSKHQDVLEEI